MKMFGSYQNPQLVTKFKIFVTKNNSTIQHQMEKALKEFLNNYDVPDNLSSNSSLEEDNDLTSINN